MAGFVLASIMLLQIRPNSLKTYVPTYSEKCHSILAEENAPDVIVVGSSRMFNGINPLVVEDELAKTFAIEGKGADATSPLKVWNLSLHYLSAAEQKRVLRDFFQTVKPSPKLVLYEPSLRVGMKLSNATTARGVYFSDVDGVLDSWNFIAGADRNFRSKAYNLGCCGVYGLVGFTNYGLFADHFFPNRYLSSSNQTVADTQLHRILAQQGYLPSEVEVAGVIRVSKSDSLHEYAELANEDHKIESQKTELYPEDQMKIFLEIDKQIRSKGCRSIAVVMPKFMMADSYYLHAEYQLSRALASNETISSLDYLSRTKHPDLYRPELWHDLNHLSNQGANYFSKLLARDIARHLQDTEN